MVSQQAFDKLTAMGVTIYQLRNASDEADAVDENSVTSDHVNKNKALTIEPALLESQTFADVLTAFNLSIGDISYDEHQIDLGLINWSFHQGEQLSLSKGRLVTPALSAIQQSSVLKKQLWQVIASNIED